ncbi:DNA N-6-adenine-methyltransferase [Corynebacterium sputi]|uniref:DNA N-6-adenine-methyltransferase n=1 Tax=Corynebacterium sputi TaxID=489915 RepID=UPI000687E824|nr:DNA N-6-adenine-methyltransferase [Corynebacterium sputi]
MTAGRKSVSDTKHWCTPPGILDSVRSVFGGKIDLDPCSNEHSLVNASVEYKLPENDGLAESWDFERIFVNPPYGSDPVRKTRIAHWFAKIAESVRNGSEVIALVPVATNTRHWKNHVFPLAAAVCFLYEPRVKFYIDGREDPKGAPMSCAIIYYGRHLESFAENFRHHGAVVPMTGVVLPPTLVELF